MRVAIVGSRAYPSEPTVRAYVRTLPPGTVVVSGGARGVDSWAEDEARRCGLPEPEVYPIDKREVARLVREEGLSWRAATGRLAHARNKVIARECDRLVAFSFGESDGTASTVGYAKELGRPTEVYEWPRVPCPADCLTCLDTHHRSGTGEEATDE
jgi:predicted Rossmann fold nucleotide-binding protein DprA/Smf involved in DNA uptake